MAIEALGIKETDTCKTKRKKLTVQEKWQIFLETSAQDPPRRRDPQALWVIYSSDLTKIHRDVESGALKELGRKRYSRKPQVVPYQEHEGIKRELAQREKP